VAGKAGRTFDQREFAEFRTSRIISKAMIERRRRFLTRALSTTDFKT
jgi:hypothetical protein